MQRSGLKFQIHATGTTVNRRCRSPHADSQVTNSGLQEGPWEQVARIIGCAHTMLHQEGIPRIQTDVCIITKCSAVIRSSGGLLADIASQDGQDKTLGGKHPNSAEHPIDLMGFEVLSE
ncbi:hypothetical protein BJX68DRAFT_222178 [Aspergillus pseudodeflectus]|uniref:Uncharacterized protein n=1 Tax=Aspergillus pseudodeflectus TaxID=176178 RepID=A0ABR4LAD3_9EURO